MKNNKSYWNYRILLKYQSYTLNGVTRSEPVFFIAEVHYEDGIPICYGMDKRWYSSKTDIKKSLQKKLEATRKPVLYAEDKFPEEVNLKQLNLNLKLV